MKVFINPGHMPGVDPGAMNPNSGLKECDPHLVAFSQGIKRFILQRGNSSAERQPKRRISGISEYL